MFENYLQFFFFLDLVAFLSAISLHLLKKNSQLISMYAIQSLAVSLLLFAVGAAEGEESLMWIAVLTFVIKVIAAPIFFSRLMRKFGAQFTASNYLSMPLTLLVLLGIVMLSYSRIFQPLAVLLPQAIGLLSLNLAIVFASIFLMLNRRGAFTQMIGILSLENGIVLFAAFIGNKQPLALEMGIIFDIVVWIAISTAFLSMIYRQFGSLNASDMRNLTED